MNRMPFTVRAPDRPRAAAPVPGREAVERSTLDERSMRIAEFLVAGMVLIAAGLLSFVR